MDGQYIYIYTWHVMSGVPSNLPTCVVTGSKCPTVPKTFLNEHSCKLLPGCLPLGQPGSPTIGMSQAEFLWDEPTSFRLYCRYSSFLCIGTSIEVLLCRVCGTCTIIIASGPRLKVFLCPWPLKTSRSSSPLVGVTSMWCLACAQQALHAARHRLEFAETFLKYCAEDNSCRTPS